MCTCDTFLCTYYLRRLQSVNIDCGTVAFAETVLSTNGFWGMGGDHSFMPYNYSIAM